MISDFSGLINPYLMNYGSYGNYGNYGSRIGYGQNGINTYQRIAARKDHTLSINHSDSVATKALKEAINRVNAAGSRPQNARGTTNEKDNSKEEKRADLNKALRKMDADDIREEVAAAALFYQYLSEKEESFLKEHDFSGEEVLDGMKNLLKCAGYGSVLEIIDA